MSRTARTGYPSVVAVACLMMFGCTFEVTSESEPQLLEGNPICPSAEMLDLIPEEALQYVQLGIGFGIQMAFEAMMGAIEDEMEEEDTGPARSIHPREMKMVQQNHPDDPNLTNTLGFQRGLEIYLDPPVDAPLDRAKLAWVEDIPQNAEVIQLEVDESLDMLPYMDWDATTVSIPDLRTCNNTDILFVTITTVEVKL